MIPCGSRQRFKEGRAEARKRGKSRNEEDELGSGIRDQGLGVRNRTRENFSNK